MLRLICLGGLLAALAVADPALARHANKHVGEVVIPASPAGVLPSGFQKWCGARFGCYTGIPLQCTAETRPYQNIQEHQCFCLHDGCP